MLLQNQITIKSRQLFLQESSIVDVRLGSKYAFDLEVLGINISRNFHRLYLLAGHLGFQHDLVFVIFATFIHYFNN